MVGLYKCTKFLSDILYTISKYVAGFYIFAVLILVSASVVLRFKNIPFSWSEEMSRWLLVGITFIGASAGLKNKKHVGLTLIRNNVFPKYIFIFVLISNTVMLLVVIMSFYYSLLASLLTITQYGDIIQIPMIFTKISLPIGFSFMIVHLIYFIVEAIYKRDELLLLYKEDVD